MKTGWMGGAAMVGLCFGGAGVVGCGARTELDVPGPPIETTPAAVADAAAADVAPDSGGPLLAFSCPFGGEPGAPWPMAGHCPDQAGFTPVVAAQTGAARWTLSLGDMLAASPVVAADGTIYVGSLAGNLFAVTPFGTLRWSHPVGGGIGLAAAIGAGGELYVVSSTTQGEAALFAVSPAGDVQWTAPVPLEGSIVVSPPTLGPEGHVYVSGALGLKAFSSSGAALWTYDPFDGFSAHPPAVGADGTVYYAPLTSPPRGPSFVALDASGNVVWQTNVTGGVTGGLSLGPGGTAYACGDASVATDSLFAVTSGAVTWTQTLPAGGWGCPTTPSIGPDGNVLFAMQFRLLSETAAGALNWTFELPAASDPPSSAAIGGDGTVYVGLSDSVRSFTSSGAPLWTYRTASPVAAPAIGADGTVYAATQDGRLIALGP